MGGKSNWSPKFNKIIENKMEKIKSLDGVLLYFWLLWYNKVPTQLGREKDCFVLFFFIGPYHSSPVKEERVGINQEPRDRS